MEDHRNRPVRSLTFSPLFFIALQCCLLADASTNHNIIISTCKKSANTDPNISYDFCLTSLQAATRPGSDPNLTKLAVISINLIRRNATNTKRFINHLLSSSTIDPYNQACLQDCLQLYSDTIPSLKPAIVSIKYGSFVDANIKVGSVLDASATCEDQFVDKPEDSVSPLTTRNRDIFQLCAISLSIINMLRIG